MSRIVDFVIRKTELLYQEDAECRLRLTNQGENPIVVVSSLRIVDQRTGIETRYRCERKEVCLYRG